MPMQIPSTLAPRDHLIIPDAHTKSGDDLRRFEALGNYIVEHRPEVIVNLGDSVDMPSLSSYDQGKKEFVFQNVQDDIESLHTAEDTLYAPLHAYNKNQIKAKKAQYTPIVVKLLGNHEDRLRKLLEYEPRWLSDTINMEVFATRHEINETVVPYMDWLTVDGVAYSHVWVSGVMCRSVPNAKAILAKKGVSATMGHTHTLDTASLTKPDGSRIRGLVAGAFLDPEFKGFGGVQVDQIYWSGIIHKHNVVNGDYDMAEISVERLLANYL